MAKKQEREDKEKRCCGRRSVVIRHSSRLKGHKISEPVLNGYRLEIVKKRLAL